MRLPIKVTLLLLSKGSLVWAESSERDVGSRMRVDDFIERLQDLVLGHYAEEDIHVYQFEVQEHREGAWRLAFSRKSAHGQIQREADGLGNGGHGDDA